MNSIFKKSYAFFFNPVDSIRLDAFRVAMGCSILLYVLFRFQHAGEWLTDGGFHVSEEYLPYHSIHVPLLPPGALPLFAVLLFGSLVAVIVGWQLRWTTWLAFACFVYVTLADQLSAFVTNKLSLVGLIIIVLYRKGPFFSTDTKNKYQTQPAWPLRILQLTLISSYFLAGWNKIIFGEWLKDPLVLWTQVQGTYRTDQAAFLIRHLPISCWMVLQYNALVFELFSPLHVGIKKLRSFGLWWGFIFQMIISVTMYQLIYFSLVVLSFYVVFLDEGLLHKINQRLHFYKGKLCLKKELPLPAHMD